MMALMKRRHLLQLFLQLGAVMGFSAITKAYATSANLAPMGTPNKTSPETNHTPKHDISSFAAAFTELLCFLRTQTRLVCVGDVNHMDKAPHAYFSDYTQLKRLNEGSYNHVFIENNVNNQKCFDQIKTNPESWHSVQDECLRQIKDNDYIDKAENSIMAKDLVDALQKLPSLSFHSVDTRRNGQEADEKNTADQILKVFKKVPGTEGGIAFYGEGHFSGITKLMGQKKSLFEYLCEAGLAPLRVNLYTSPEAHKAHRIYLAQKSQAALVMNKSIQFTLPAVDFIANGSEEPIILFHDKKLEEAYKQAQKKNEASNTMGRRQFLSSLLPRHHGPVNA